MTNKIILERHVTVSFKEFLMAEELSTIVYHGAEYSIADKYARDMIEKVGIEHDKKLDAYRQGIMELATRMDSMTKKLSVSVDDSMTFPILRFDISDGKGFSTCIDITLICGGMMMTFNELLKYYNGRVYRKTIDSNFDVDTYFQASKSSIYIFMDTPSVDRFSFKANILCYDGEPPSVLLDEEKFSLDKYKSAIRLE